MRPSMLKRGSVVAMVLGLSLAVGAQGATAVLPFSEPDFEWFAGGGSATPYHIWTNGDYWRQNFPATGLPVAETLLLELNVNDLASQTINLDVFLNAVDVGDFSLTPGSGGAQAFNFSFPPVVGDSYSVSLVASSTISPGAGSYSISLDQGASRMILSGGAVPEPSTLLLTGAGVLLAVRPRARRTVLRSC